MNTRHVIIALAGLLLPTSIAAQEKAVRIFKPVSPWAMEYADHACRLIRNFSDGPETVTLAFEKTLPGTTLTLGLAGKSLQLAPKATRVRLRYDEDQSARTSAFMKTVLADGRDSLLITDAAFLPEDETMKIWNKTGKSERWAVLEKKEMEAASRTTSIALTHGFVDNAAFAIGPMAPPLKAMQACVEDLVRNWGVDLQRMATMSRSAEAVGSPQSWFSFNDYPEDMWRKHEGGIVPVRLVIDETGVVKECLVTVEQRGPFEDAVCKAIGKRARFRPAIDADGKPFQSYWARAVIFPRY